MGPGGGTGVGVWRGQGGYVMLEDYGARQWLDNLTKLYTVMLHCSCTTLCFSWHDWELEMCGCLWLMTNRGKLCRRSLFRPGGAEICHLLTRATNFWLLNTRRSVLSRKARQIWVAGNESCTSRNEVSNTLHTLIYEQCSNRTRWAWF